MADPYLIRVYAGKALVGAMLPTAARMSTSSPQGEGSLPPCAPEPHRVGSAMARSLEAELAAAIEAAGPRAPPPDFAAWALSVFAHQFERNAPYRAFCARRGVTPATVARWEDVPAVPSAAFRRVDLACGPPEAVFRTSGTTGAGARGRHLVPHLALYRASALATF